MAARYSFSGRLHGPQGVMVHPDLTGDKFYLQVRDGDSAVGGGEITELMDCRIGGDDMHGKYGFAGSRGVPNGSSPAYLKPVFTDGGELDWLSMAYLEENNRCRIVRGAPVLLLKDGLERGFFKSWREFHAIVGISLSEADVTRCMYDVAFMESVLFRGTIVPMLSGLTECACRRASTACWWLGSGPCFSCMKKTGMMGRCPTDDEVYSGEYRREGDVLVDYGAGKYDGKIACYADALRRTALLLMPLPWCFSSLFVSHPVLRCLGYVRAVFRALVRKLQLTRRGETKRLIPPFFQGLMALHYAYTTDEELRTAAASVDGVRYTYGGSVGGSEFWEGSCPLGVYGPYAFPVSEGIVVGVADATKAVALLGWYGGYDFLLNGGVAFRPLEEKSSPYLFLGGYGKFDDGGKGEGRRYLQKSGSWGVDMVFRGEEGEVMAGHINFDHYPLEMKAGLQMGLGLEEIRRRILDGVAFD